MVQCKLSREVAELRKNQKQVDRENELLNEYKEIEEGKSNNEKSKIDNEIN